MSTSRNCEWLSLIKEGLTAGDFYPYPKNKDKLLDLRMMLHHPDTCVEPSHCVFHHRIAYVYIPGAFHVEVRSYPVLKN